MYGCQSVRPVLDQHQAVLHGEGAYQFRSHVALHKRICGNDSAQDLTGKVIVIETQYRIKFFTTQKIIVHERCLATSMKNR